jgi:hypothetical protein
VLIEWISVPIDTMSDGKLEMTATMTGIQGIVPIFSKPRRSVALSVDAIEALYLP